MLQVRFFVLLLTISTAFLFAPCALASLDVAFAAVDSEQVLQSATSPLDFLATDTAALDKSARDAYGAGEYEKAIEYYLEYLKYNITDSANIYNLACCYALLGDARHASMCFAYAYAAGFDALGQVEWDKDFDPVRESDIFKETIAKLTEKEAVRNADAGELLHIESPAYFNCRIKLPDGYDPEKEYPLVVGLHGHGSNEERFIGLWKKFDNPQFIYATPQAPYRFGAGSTPMRSWGLEDSVSEEEYIASQALTEQYVCDVVNALKAKYKVNNVYLLGFSQGCFMAYVAGLKHHELFDGLICFGGWLDVENIGEDNIEAAKSLHVFIGHASDDPVIEFESGKTALETLKTHGYDVRFFEFTGGHTVPLEALIEVQAWLDKIQSE